MFEELLESFLGILNIFVGDNKNLHHENTSGQLKDEKLLDEVVDYWLPLEVIRQ